MVTGSETQNRIRKEQPVGQTLQNQWSDTLILLYRGKKRTKYYFPFPTGLPEAQATYHRPTDSYYGGNIVDLGPSTWLAQYNAPCTDRGDTDITGHSIIQLSSKAVPDSFKSAWRSAAKQSPRQRSAAFISQTPQHGLNYNSSLSARCLPEHCELEKEKNMPSFVFYCSLFAPLYVLLYVSLWLTLSSFQFPFFYWLWDSKAKSSSIPNSNSNNKNYNNNKHIVSVAWKPYLFSLLYVRIVRLIFYILVKTIVEMTNEKNRKKSL